MNDFGTMLNNMGWNLTHRLGIVDIIDIIIMAAIFSFSVRGRRFMRLNPLDAFEPSGTS